MRNIEFRTAVVAAVVVLLGAPTFATATEACGNEGQAPCFSIWNLINKGNPAAKESFPCPAGQFFDLIDGGTCWSCPADYVRTWDSVKTSTACVRHASESTRGATRHEASNIFRNCPTHQGQFFDIGNGYCWSCPAGFGRTLAPVTAGNACAATIPKDLKPATSHGTGVIGCNAGLRDIRGTCMKEKVCGGKGQRPCLMDERVPSCDETPIDPLKEDFKQNKCVPCRPGETPFLGGVASLGQFYGDLVQGTCKSWLGEIKLPAEGDLGVGLNCGKDVVVGIACAALRDLVASATDKVASFADLTGTIGKASGDMALAIDKAYRSEACMAFEEHLESATRHDKAKGLDCPAGQFWDPNGYCWSCPKDYSRTFYSVEGPKACVNHFGGELLRSGCAVYTAIKDMFDQPLSCTVQVLQDGTFFEQPLDLSKANHTVCLATGELGYALLALAVDTATAAVTGDVTKILGAIGRLKKAVQEGQEINRLLKCGRGEHAGLDLLGGDSRWADGPQCPLVQSPLEVAIQGQ